MNRLIVDLLLIAGFGLDLLSDVRTQLTHTDYDSRLRIGVGEQIYKVDLWVNEGPSVGDKEIYRGEEKTQGSHNTRKQPNWLITDH